MSKGAYFLPLYYQRLLTSTTGWKDDEFGAYLRLLIYQFDKGCIPNDIESIARIAPSAKKTWKVIGEKFTVCEDGNLRNSVMENIRNKQLKKSEINSKNGKKGGIAPKRTVSERGSEMEANASDSLKRNESNTNMVNGLLVNGIPEGGAGETEYEWIWDKEKEKFFQAGDWVFQFCKSKKLTVNQFDSLAKEFVTDLELKSDYKPVKEIRSHFTNWFNKKKAEIKTERTPSGGAPPLQKL